MPCQLSENRTRQGSLASRRRAPRRIRGALRFVRPQRPKRRRGVGGYHAAMAGAEPVPASCSSSRVARCASTVSSRTSRRRRPSSCAPSPRAAMERGPQIRDLRALPWCSIDNDDSRDLDQLSVAQPLDGGEVKILVAIADVDATVAPGSPIDAHAQHQHHFRLHGRGDLPDAAGAAVDRPDLSGRGSGSAEPRHRHDALRRMASVSCLRRLPGAW